MPRPCTLRRVLGTCPAVLAPAAALALALAVTPAPAAASSGGAASPDFPAPGPEHSGGALAVPRLRTMLFAVSTSSVQVGRSLRFAWRVDGPVRSVTARVELVPEGGGAPLRVALGTRRTGTRSSRKWTARQGRVTAGRYVARLRVTGPSGVRLRRTAHASGRAGLEVTAPAAPGPAPAPVPVVSGLFPVQGPYSFGGPEARFGAGRTGHVHQGQDVMAAEGTPLVTPVSGVVHWKAYQAGGAGYYLVIHGDDGRDYAFMHLQAPAAVETGQRVAAGQRIGNVGSTGDAHGSHLHFEIWLDGWFASAASHPIDPLPQLLAWAAG